MLFLLYEQFHLQDLVGELFQTKLQQMTLSFIHEGKALYSNESTLLKPMEVYGFLIKFHQNLDIINNAPGNSQQ